jgi:predicted site-specific integrase-resolvase
MIGDSWMIGMTEAAKLTGKQRQTIHKAIKEGRVSAVRSESGEWRIDPAELFRVYTPVSTMNDNQNDKVDSDLQRIDSGLQRELELLRERIREKDSIIDDLREDRDHWRQQATALLTDQRPQAPQKAVQGRFTRAWSILKGRT